MIKDKNKEVYTSPQTEALVVRFEGALLSGSDPVFSTENGTEEFFFGGEENF